MAETRSVVLLIEDDPGLQTALRDQLEEDGMKVLQAMNLAMGRTLATSHHPDVVVLDLGLPDGDGMSFINEYHAGPWSILVLTARDQEQDKVNALDAGADDFMTKPFSLVELSARLRAMLRRRSQVVYQSHRSTMVEQSNLTVDFYRKKAVLGGEALHLSPREYELLSYFIKNSDCLLTHRQILQDIWGTSNMDQGTALRMFVAKLRKKLEPYEGPNPIETEIGIGYRWSTRSRP